MNSSIPNGTKTAREEAGDAFLLYCQEIHRLPLLTREEEDELARRARQGDESAREKMIVSNLRLVVHIARHYDGLGGPRLDLINEGNIGLMKAVDRFDPTRGAKLSTYAAWWIRQTMRRALANDGRTVRLPVHVVEKLHHLRRAENHLLTALGREPSTEELAQELGVSTVALQRMRAAAHMTVTIDDEGEEGQREALIHSLSDDGARPGEALEEESDLEMISAAFAALSEREAFVLNRRFGFRDGIERTLHDVSRQLGLSRERVRQLEKTAIDKLRRAVEQREKESRRNLPSWPST